jgi:hypothetical protein
MNMSRDFRTYRKSLSVDILFPPPLAITKDKQLSAKIKLRPHDFILKSIRGKNILGKVNRCKNLTIFLL